LARKPRNTTNGDTLIETADYRHPGKRKNIPPATMERQGTVPKAEKAKYYYNPHLPTVLRFDPSGESDQIPALIATAQSRPLSEAEASLLAEAIKNQRPWLEWTGKKEEHDRGVLTVNPVALHLHERISAKAIVRGAMRQDVERSLFAAAEDNYGKAVQFYKHDIDWANRLILGDSLEVMSSLARREGLAGKVQMIYMDPPYGIKYGGNFQPKVDKASANDTESGVNREPEMVRAYRDTWHLGVHSYLSYLRDRLLVAKDLLSDTGSIFVQISDANVHRVREVMDDVFGSENFMLTLLLKKKGGQKSGTMDPINDYILWTTKDRERAATKFRRVFVEAAVDEDYLGEFSLCEFPSGEVLSVSQLSKRTSVSYADRPDQLLKDFPEARLLTSGDAAVGGVRKNQSLLFPAFGRTFDPGLDKGNCWKHTARRLEDGTRSGMDRMLDANRIWLGDGQIRVKRYGDDFGATAVTNWWDEFGGAKDRVYAVQTNFKVVERCMMLTTDPGDLVLDPTCGSGTTAFSAEQWGRRWITIDTSRVALAIARQRLLTARYEYYRTRSADSSSIDAGVAPSFPDNPARGFRYKTKPHITSSVVANCTALDPIFTKHGAILDKTLTACNHALKKVNKQCVAKLKDKWDQKLREEGKRSLSDADRRRWVLPPENRDPKVTYTVDADFAGWYHWEVPFDTDPDWPKELVDTVMAYRKAWRAKLDEVNDCIAKSADQEDLVDQPQVVKGVTRVSGPFTVEGVIPEEMALTEDGIKDLTPNEDDDGDAASDLQNIHAYLKGMVDAIRTDGLTFPNNKKGTFAEVTPLYEGGALDALHADGFWSDDAKKAEPVAIAFGPQYGPITARQVEDCIHAATRYRHLVLAGFSFAPEAAAIVAEQSHPKLKIHLANIRPDMNPAMKGLLKETPNSQLFSVFGLPEIKVKQDKDGKHIVVLKGVDIFDPVENTVRSTGASKVAAWFLDSDFDNRCFCTTQAFFPNQDAWGKIAKALGSAGNEDAFEAFKGTESLPFEAGEHKRIAVKVIDPRGNEVMTVRKLS
jgi:adenine-specific DNA-methyltransferase